MPYKDPQKRKEAQKIYDNDPIHKKRKREFDKNWMLQKRYGITTDQFNKILLKQENSCGCCKKEFNDGKKPCVDHDHKTGKIRGLVCINCNVALGAIDENTDILMNLINWVKN